MRQFCGIGLLASLLAALGWAVAFAAAGGWEAANRLSWLLVSLMWAVSFLGLFLAVAGKSFLVRFFLGWLGVLLAMAPLLCLFMMANNELKSMKSHYCYTGLGVLLVTGIACRLFSRPGDS